MSDATTPEREAARARAKAQWTPEARAAQSARMKEVRARASASTPSKSSRPSSGPQPLPSPARREQLAEGMLERLTEQLAERLGSPEKTAKTERLLPDDWEEREECLRLAKLPARIPVQAVDELARVFDLLPLSPEEREQGIDAWAALFWQLGLFRNGWVLVVLWLTGVAIPRGAEAWRRAQAEKRGQLAPKPRPREPGERPDVRPPTMPAAPPTVPVVQFEKREA